MCHVLPCCSFLQNLQVIFRCDYLIHCCLFDESSNENWSCAEAFTVYNITNCKLKCFFFSKSWLVKISLSLQSVIDKFMTWHHAIIPRFICNPHLQMFNLLYMRHAVQKTDHNRLCYTVKFMQSAHIHKFLWALLSCLPFMSSACWDSEATATCSVQNW